MITLRAARHDRADAVLAEPARPTRVRPDLRVVDEPTVRRTAAASTTRRSAGGAVGTMLVVLLFVCVFGVVVFQVFLVQTQSHLDQLDRDIATQEAKAKDLRLRTTDLEAPERIVKDAKDRLGMIAPGDVVYLQPGAGDDAKAAFDARREAPPSTAAPAAAGAGAAGAATGTARGATTATTAWTPPTTAWKPATGSATSTVPKTTPTTSSAATTSPTSTPKTTATTAPKTTTTVARSTPTTTARTR